jgi:AcrR family transcriptional regulator
MSYPLIGNLDDDETLVELSSHDRILLAARTLFSSQGYENTTTSAIARNAGTSESQLIKHFGSKEGLLAAIFDQAWLRMGRSMGPALSQCPTPLDRFWALSELLISAMEQDKDVRTLMLLEGRRIRKHGHMVVLTRGYLQVVGVVDRVLQEMREAGQLRTDLNLEAVRSAIVGAFEGLLRDRLLAERSDYPARYDEADVRAAYRAAVSGFLTPGATPSSADPA